MEESKTGLYITVKVLRMLSRGNTWKPFKCDRGPIFQVTDLNWNLAQFRPSEIHYQPDPIERNGSLDMWQPEMWRTYHKCVLIVNRKAILKSRVFIKLSSLKFYHWNLHRKISVLLQFSLMTLLVITWCLSLAGPIVAQLGVFLNLWLSVSWVFFFVLSQ